MQSLFFKGLKENAEHCVIFRCDYDIEVLVLCFPYGYKSDSFTGYAHLLEHMLIKIGKKEFDDICKNGILFNAVTKEYTTEYMFINLRGGDFLEKNYRKIESIFSDVQIEKTPEKLLEIEKKVILEEFLILENRFQSLAAEQMVGSKYNIRNFSLEEMSNKYYTFYTECKSILLTDSRRINNKSYSVLPSIQYDFVGNLVVSSKNQRLLVKNNIEAKIVLFFLHLCINAQLDRKWDAIVEESQELVIIKITGKFNINEKQHILSRYFLLCTNLKFYIDEISYLLANNLLGLNIEQAFMEDWERGIYGQKDKNLS